MKSEDQFKNINPDIRDFSDQVEKFLKTRELAKFRVSFIEKMTILIISAFGLIAALAWDEALKELFRVIFKNLSAMQEKFLYAVIITILAITLSIILSKLILKKESTN